MPRGPALRNQMTEGRGRARGPRVVVLTGPAERRSLPVTASVTIGRDPDVCDLVVGTAGVARRHTRLIPVEGGVAVRDLRTRLGTFRNGRLLLGPERLEDGDVITVGDVDLRYDEGSRPRPRAHPQEAGPEAADDGEGEGAGPHPAGQGTEAGAAGDGERGRRRNGQGRREARRSALAEALRGALATDAGAPPEAPSRTVLLCHDPADRDLADLLVSYLQRRGHAVWIDRSGPGAHDGWRGRLLDVVWSSDAALFLVSPASAGSERAQREVHVAGAEHLPVLPVVVGSTELGPDLAWYLTAREPIDLRRDPMAGLATLAVAVEALPARHLARPRRVAIALLVAAALLTLGLLGIQALLG